MTSQPVPGAVPPEGELLATAVIDEVLPVEIHRAVDGDMARYVGSIDGEPRDTMQPWTMVRVKALDDGRSILRVLGWRTGMLNTWITTPVRVIDPVRGMVMTHSGRIYRLSGEPIAPVPPILHDHLIDALTNWRYTYVEDARRRSPVEES